MVPTPALVWWLRSRASSTISFSWTRPPARQSRCCRRTCPTRQTASSSVTRYVLVLAVVVVISNKLQFFDAHTHELNFLFCPMSMKATKDCDYWQTASFDTATSTLYYQVRITCSFFVKYLSPPPLMIDLFAVCYNRPTLWTSLAIRASTLCSTWRTR